MNTTGASASNRLVRLSLCAATSAALTSWGGVAAAEGFVEDAKATLKLRNYYFNRNFLDQTAGGQSQAEAWAQGFILDARSGYSAGTVGFGVDLLGGFALRLDGNRTAAHSFMLPMSEGRPADGYGRASVALKARVAATELKAGEWQASLPLLRSNDGRMLPQTFRGVSLDSREVEGLNLYAGHFGGTRHVHDAGHRDLAFGRTHANHMNLAGGEYRFNDQHSHLGLWHAELSDIYRQSLVQLTHRQPLEQGHLGYNLGYLTGRDTGGAKAGKLSNQVYQGAFSGKLGAHGLAVSRQHLGGRSRFLRVNGSSGATLVNDGFTSSFDSPRERSWQLRHDYAVVPGMTLMNRYTRGSNIHVGKRTDAREWARESEVAYSVQDGSLKGMSLRWRNSSVRRDVGVRADENRLIIEYPLSVL